MHARLVLAAAALTVLGATSAPALAQSPSPVDCATPRGIDQVRACEVARRGTAPLRRFAESTRRIYAIHVPDYLGVAQQAESTQPRAQAPEALPQSATAERRPG